AEELAEDPRSLGVDLQRALPIGQPAHPHVAVLEPARGPATAEHVAGAAELDRLAGGERVAQVAADVKDQEEGQQRARDRDDRVAAARARNVRELVDDACRVAGGPVGWSRIGHVCRGVGPKPSTGWALLLPSRGV